MDKNHRPSSLWFHHLNSKQNDDQLIYEEKNPEDKINSFHLFEIYKDTKALDFHRNTAHYKNYRSEIINLLNRPIEVKVLSSVDTK